MKKGDPAIAGSPPHFTRHFLAKPVIAICGNSSLLFRGKIPEIVALCGQHRSMADVFLNAIDGPTLLEAFNGKLVPKIMQPGIKPCFLSVFPEEVRRVLVIAVFGRVPENIGRDI